MVVFLPSLPGQCLQMAHPCLTQLASCEQVRCSSVGAVEPSPHHRNTDDAACMQVLSTRYSRNLLLLKKTGVFNEEASLASIAQQAAAFTALDCIHDAVFEAKAREESGLCKPMVKAAYRSKLV